MSRILPRQLRASVAGVNPPSHGQPGRARPGAPAVDPAARETPIKRADSPEVSNEGATLSPSYRPAPDISAQIIEQRGNRRKIEVEAPIAAVKQLPQKLRRLLLQHKLQKRRELDSLKFAERSRFSDLAHFKAANNLARDPKTSAHSLTNMLFIAFVVLSEGVLNAFSFAEASPSGLIGGLYAAFAISIMNAFAGAFVGAHGLRELHHNKVGHRLLGIIALMAWLSVALVTNLLAGHYRAAIDLDADGAARSAWTNFAAHSFVIESAQGWMLFSIGMAAGVAVVAKLFLSDDPYPGYGAIFRQWTLAVENSTRSLQELAALYVESYEQVEAEREKLLKSSTVNLALYEAGLGASQILAFELESGRNRALRGPSSASTQVPGALRGSTEDLESCPLAPKFSAELIEETEEFRRLKSKVKRLLEQEAESIKAELDRFYIKECEQLEAESAQLDRQET